jgi:hypothetical protein
MGARLTRRDGITRADRRMSTSQPPLGYGRIVTLITGYSSGDGARFWSSQS